jgi:phosphoglucosamine mutase
MFGTSGIRGPVGETVTADVALAVGRAVVSTGANRVIVGRDARESGELLQAAVSAGIRECGGDVIPCRVLPTTTCP